MLDAVLNKLGPVIFRFIQPNNQRDAKMLKDLEIVFRLIASLVFLVINWTHESNELIGNDPVQITVLNLFIILIFLGIKRLKLVPS